MMTMMIPLGYVCVMTAFVLSYSSCLSDVRSGPVGLERSNHTQTHTHTTHNLMMMGNFVYFFAFTLSV